MSNRTLTPVVVCLLACSALGWAQSPDAPSAPLKIGVINMQGAIANTAEGKKALGDLQKKYEPRQRELQQQNQEIAALQDQLQRGANTLSDDEQRRLQRELEVKQTRLKRMQEDLQADAQADQQEVVNRIGQKMVRLMNEYAQQNSYSIILDGGAQMPIYYVAPQVDLTEVMIKKYDAANPADAGTPPPTSGSSAAPAAPKTTNPVKPLLPKPKQ